MISIYVDDPSGPLFPVPQGTLPWQPILGKIGIMTFIRQAGVPKLAGYGSSDSKIFNGNIAATSCENMIKICPVTPYIARVTTALFGRDGKKIGIFHQIS